MLANLNIKGRNILLRTLRDSDLDFLYFIENNIENWQFGSEQKIFTKNELLDYIANAKIDIEIAKQYRFVIDLQNQPIGFIDLFDYTNKYATIGVFISKDYRNRGFATEALNLLIDYAFNQLNLQKLYCTLENSNLFSSKLFVSCGFVFHKQLNDMLYFIKLAKN